MEPLGSSDTDDYYPCDGCTMKKEESKKSLNAKQAVSEGYVNFLREFRKKNCNMTAAEIAQEAMKCWNAMSPEEKQKYRSEEKPRSSTPPCPCQCPGKCTQKPANRSEGTSSKPRRKSRSRTRGSKRCGTRSRSSSRRSSRSRSSSRGCNCKRSRVRSSSRSSCGSGSRNRRRRAQRRRSSGSGRCQTCGSNRPQRVKCMRLGRVTNNAYLNFLRSFRRKHCGLSPQEVIRRGARKWCLLTPEQKEPYYRMARRVSRNQMRNGN